MLKAAVKAKEEGYCFPILLGNEERIEKLAQDLSISIEGIEIVNLRHDREEDRRSRYAKILTEKRGREGLTFNEAFEKMNDRNYFGMMMVETGEADAFITGTYTKYSETTRIAKEVIGIRTGFKHFGAMHIVNSKKGTFFLSDTLINRHPTTETLIDIARLTNNSVKFFAHEPVMAMISYSNFGADDAGSPAAVHSVVASLHKDYPEMVVDGEMQVNFALNKKLRDTKFPFSKLNNKDVNTLIFPNLSSANAAYKLMREMGGAEVIGPIQMGLNKPIHFTDIESTVRDIVNLTVISVMDAMVTEKMNGNVDFI
jgi:malate dehydrogenase (oxaloacetate-decarboxylating)(NADP+)